MKQNKTSTVLLHEFTAFGEEEKGKKGMQLESNPFLSLSFSHYYCLVGNSFEDYIHVVYTRFIHSNYF